jgi:hypothetical protein
MAASVHSCLAPVLPVRPLLRRGLHRFVEETPGKRKFKPVLSVPQPVRNVGQDRIRGRPQGDWAIAIPSSELI